MESALTPNFSQNGWLHENEKPKFHETFTNWFADIINIYLAIICINKI